MYPTSSLSVDQSTDIRSLSIIWWMARGLIWNRRAQRLSQKATCWQLSDFQKAEGEEAFGLFHAHSRGQWERGQLLSQLKLKIKCFLGYQTWKEETGAQLPPSLVGPREDPTLMSSLNPSPDPLL